MAVARAAHSRAGHDARMVVLTDNLAVALSASRYRARDHKLLTIIRRIGSYCLARQLKVFPRWVPSEYNPSDDDSRFYIDSHEVGKGLTHLFRTFNVLRAVFEAFCSHFRQAR